MFAKLQNRLLTHNPLIWNTKLVWMAFSLLVIHGLFYLAGFADLAAKDFQHYSSLFSTLSGSLLTFSILCSLVVLILWLVFYLRNNAYKNFLIIGKRHLSKEFLIICLVIFPSIIFFESYKWGGGLKARTITNKQQLVSEANTVNLAMAFIPASKSAYFKLTTCDPNLADQNIYYQDDRSYFDTTANDYNSSNNIIIRRALRDKDAFNYKNYCREVILLNGYRGFIPAKQWMATRDRWIDHHQVDSIKYVLAKFFDICKKYDVDVVLSADELSALPFADSSLAVTKFFPIQAYDWENGTQVLNPSYIELYSLTSALRFAEFCQLNGTNDDLDTLTIELYIALCLSILLFCYRLYSRRTFLISFIGIIVWSILFSLLGVSAGGEDGFLWIFLVFSFLFGISGLLLVKAKTNKTMAGAFLNWYIYMAPFILILIASLVKENYQSHTQWEKWREVLMKKEYPIGYWVNNHMWLITRLNLMLVFLYVAFIFTRVSRKWHIMPDE